MCSRKKYLPGESMTNYRSGQVRALIPALDSSHHDRAAPGAMGGLSCHGGVRGFQTLLWLVPA